MKLRKQAQHYIKQLAEIIRIKKKGGTQMYVIGMIILMLFVILFRVLLDFQRVSVTYYSVDDALTTSLLSSCIYNREEQALSGSMVIYRTVTQRSDKTVIPADLSVDIKEIESFDAINSEQIYVPAMDTYLEKCYQRFLKNLKKNLKLDNNMNTSISGIDGIMEIAEFSVFNKFINLNKDGTSGDFRIVKYTRSHDGTWSAYIYPINQYASCYNSIDHTEHQITDTSVSARLHFTLVTRTEPMPDGLEVDYQRVVDITK